MAFTQSYFPIVVNIRRHKYKLKLFIMNKTDILNNDWPKPEYYI